VKRWWGISAPNCPEEIYYTFDILPIRILGSHEIQDVTEPHLFAMFCPFYRDVLAQGLKGKYDQPLNPNPASSLRCCGHFAIDTQGQIPYSPSLKKEVLITSLKKEVLITSPARADKTGSRGHTRYRPAQHNRALPPFPRDRCCH